jgi:uncharacterized membrane protein
MNGLFIDLLKPGLKAVHLIETFSHLSVVNFLHVKEYCENMHVLLKTIGYGIYTCDLRMMILLSGNVSSLNERPLFLSEWDSLV